ncbi:RHS domain-containing protein [Massilia sp. H6]|uniref:RHS domain-containing protein n=1 Tax=Massilia sp. H6 TaxID=2970464 RepID=UPI00216A6D0A|nr:RHS domain-containing protein [Massilia sp. H6]UVW27050.1 RHS domain-containing protein [Massilia sp. H6]
MYGWDGDMLALESSVRQGYAADERTVHYVYERDSFVPLVQATRSRALRLAPTTDVKALLAGNDGKYDIALDPLWNGEYEHEAEPFGKEEIAFYQCDHLGTPQELTDCEGKVAWSAQYKAWGQQRRRSAMRRTGLGYGIRFGSRDNTLMKRPDYITTGIVTRFRHGALPHARSDWSTLRHQYLCIRPEPCRLDRSARAIWQFGTEKNIPSCCRKE